jgi:micrococcal nuclease
VRRAAVVAVLLGLLAVGLLVAAAARETGRERRSATVEVLSVIDGDTIRVRMPSGRERAVRYIGIDTPETPPGRPAECHGPEAAAANGDLVAGRRVRLEFDREREDRYGRLLAYVHRGGVLVNEELVRAGHARPLRVEPNVRHAQRLESLAREARAAGRGLWGACGVTDT